MQMTLNITNDTEHYKWHWTLQMTLNITNDTEHYKEFKNNQRTNQGISSLSTQRANEKFC
jgi:hypothetical protein